MLSQLKSRIEQAKAEIESLRPLSTAALAQLQKHYDVELTYTSNAIEGNMLTLRETAEVIEHGLTVGGKPLHDRLEAVDHYQALLWMREIAAKTTTLGEDVVRELHRRIVARSQSEIAGHYSRFPRSIAGSPVIFPNPAKIPELMNSLGAWLAAAPLDAETAFAAHYRLTAIHPFGDGNGRTARLLMNLLLIRGGYPPVAVRPVDRKSYLDALERGSLTQDWESLQLFMHERLEATLADYLGAIREALPAPQRE
jgi:Fic family protein